MRAEDRQRLIALAGRRVTRVTGVAGVTPSSARHDAGSKAGVTGRASVTPPLETAGSPAAEEGIIAVTPVTPVTRVTMLGEISQIVRPEGHATGRHVDRGDLDHLLRGLPEDWRTGLARLPQMEPPTGFTDARWAVGVISALPLARRFGGVALEQGWVTEDLFGLHPVAPAARYDAMGLAFLLHPGDQIVSITSQHATIQRRSGALQRAARLLHPVERIAAWSFSA